MHTQCCKCKEIFDSHDGGIATEQGDYCPKCENQVPLIIEVEMLAYGNGQIRNVSIDGSFRNKPIKEVLNAVFLYGQNEIQPSNLPSVSIGDIAHYKGLHIVRCHGFGKISKKEAKEFKSLPRIELVRSLLRTAL